MSGVLSERAASSGSHRSYSLLNRTCRKALVMPRTTSWGVRPTCLPSQCWFPSSTCCCPTFSTSQPGWRTTSRPLCAHTSPSAGAIGAAKRRCWDVHKRRCGVCNALAACVWQEPDAEDEHSRGPVLPLAGSSGR